MNGITNSLFIFVGEGDIILAMLVTCLNGAPLGARFLNDSTLADTIDYDEFMSGERREAQFTMFISFVPKIVSIPTQALPIALIAAAGFIESEDTDGDGVVDPQDQPNSVKTVISIIYIGLPVVMNIFSFYIKWNYPIYNEEMNRKISEGIVLHASGLPATDPITGKVIPPKGNLSEGEVRRSETRRTSQVGSKLIPCCSSLRWSLGSSFARRRSTTGTCLITSASMT